MPYDYSQFRSTVSNDYDRRRWLSEGSLDLSASQRLLETKALGHPRYEPLAIGQSATAPITAVFLDLSQFTRRTFWDPPQEVANLAHAVMTGFIEAVVAFGGFPLGLRGDGLFAGFGPGVAATDCTYALACAAFCLNGVENEINPWLEGRDIYPVKARAGVDHGDVVFVRSGSQEQSEVNVIGFAANFAAKCEKTAGAWEVVVGQTAVEHLGDAELCTKHKDSPKQYDRGTDRRYYHFYDYAWRKTLSTIPSALRELDGQPTTSITFGY